MAINRYLFIFGSDTGYRTHGTRVMPKTMGSSGVSAELDRHKHFIRDLLLAPLSPGQQQDLYLGPFNVIFNTIGDPDLNPRTLAYARQICDRSGLPVINDPESISRSSRDGVYDLAPDDGPIIVPRTVRLKRARRREITEKILDLEIDFPVLCRPAGSHAGIGLKKHDSRAELLARFENGYEGDAPVPDHYVTQFVDFVSPDGLYRKYRFYLIGDKILPRHTMVASSWNVHGKSQLAGKNGYEHLITEEEDFRDNFKDRLGSERAAALARFRQKLGLDLCGIDCNLADDGSLVVFEANPNMDVRRADESSPRYHLNQSSYEAIVAATEELLAIKARQRETG